MANPSKFGTVLILCKFFVKIYIKYIKRSGVFRRVEAPKTTKFARKNVAKITLNCGFFLCLRHQFYKTSENV